MNTGTAAEKGVIAEVSVRTDENAAHFMTKHLALARDEEPLSGLWSATVFEGACGRVHEIHESRLTTLTGCTDHVATVSPAQEIMLLVVVCVVLVARTWSCLQLLRAYCCSLETCQGSLPKYDGVSETAIATESECSARTKADGSNLARRASRIALCRRALPNKSVEG